MSAEQEITPEGILNLANPVDLPEVLDLLIVGGGPGGTAAAFRARESGLSALVIDFDDLMKRIRDYAKDKLILPDFGGGDKMKFPKGDAVISLLHFSPIDKDDMCVEWKRFYRENNIPAHIGVELTGLDQGADRIWHVKTWNHNTKAEHIYKAKHVIISIGRGVPRRFDIPGNTDGIAYKLSDPTAYVDGPVCVIGGGTSAAEAVIGISNAKIQANDPSYVYWSYRGAKMPKVSKALADVFFEASVGNGNIRLHLCSEPVAVVTAENRKEYLSIRIDRKFIDHRPNETHHIEFPKERCIACIGEDIPEGFLNSLGISMATGGPNNKKRMVVTPLLETQQPNVYLVGDILSQAYFETQNFDADPTTFREVKHRGNIKSALRDGVYAVEVIKQKLEGKENVAVTLEDAEAIVEKKASAKAFIEVEKAVEADSPPEKSVEPVRPAQESNARLVRILPGNIEEDEYPLKVDATVSIGRKECDIAFHDDTLLSDKHASIAHTSAGYILSDDGSKNGVFLRATEASNLEVAPGDLVKVGRQFLVFSVSGGDFYVIHYDHKGKEVHRHKLPGKAIILGRQAPDVTLDSSDMTLSRRHVAISRQDNKIYIKDLKSVNGTYLKVKNSVKLKHGDQFRLGQQVFNFSSKSEAILDRGHSKEAPLVVVPPVAAPSSPKPQAAEKPEPAAESPAISVIFKGLGKTIAVKPGQTLCEVAEENDIELNAECHAGVCGSDVIKIIAGEKHFSEMDEQEKETLEDLCGLNPNEFRLACMTKISGPVEIEIVDN